MIKGLITLPIAEIASITIECLVSPKEAILLKCRDFVDTLVGNMAYLPLLTPT
jgi:hypothetical protein